VFQSSKTRPSRTLRLAVILAIFGLGQTLAPSLLRHSRPSLKVSQRFSVPTPLTAVDVERLVTTATTSEASWSEAEPENESSEAPTGSNDLLELENLTWPEGTTPRRSVQGSHPRDLAALSTSLPVVEDSSERARGRDWSLSVSRATPVKLTARLCRFLC